MLTEEARHQKGFTLIELLIVIAIILILIAIALPNFLEAQIRAKITRVKSEFKMLEVAIESYRTDYAFYPIGGSGVNAPANIASKYPRKWRVTFTIGGVYELTTPVKYLNTNHYTDPFVGSGMYRDDLGAGTITDYYYLDYYTFGTDGSANPGWRSIPGYKPFDSWALASWGPDVDDSGVTWIVAWEKTFKRWEGGWGGVFYSPTNGTSSTGDIVKIGNSAGTPMSMQFAR